MRAHGSSSWRVSIRDNSPFTVALYVREAFGLSVEPEIPLMTPAVPFLEKLDVDPTDWDRWWDEIIAAGPEIWRVAPPTGPDLFLAYERVVLDIGRWADREHHRPDMASPDALRTTHLVADLEKSLGRRASFSYCVDALPVSGTWHRDLSPTWLLVSTEVWLDADLLMPLLDERLRLLM